MANVKWYWWVLIGVAVLLVIGYFTNWFGMKKPTVVLMSNPSNDPVLRRVPNTGNTTINVITSQEDLSFCNAPSYQEQLAKYLSLVQISKAQTQTAYNTWLADKSTVNCDAFKLALVTETNNVTIYNNTIKKCYPSGPFSAVSSFESTTDCLGVVNLTAGNAQ